MISSIGSSNSYQIQVKMRFDMASRKSGLATTQGEAPSPQGKGLFADLDTDSSGGISQSELQVLADGVSKVTGAEVDAQKILGTYDADGNGELGGTELRDALMGLGIEPPPPPRSSPPNNATGRQESSNLSLADLNTLSSSPKSQDEKGDSSQNAYSGQYASYQSLMTYLRQTNGIAEGIDTVA